jgi:hypothetical protein
MNKSSLNLVLFHFYLHITQNTLNRLTQKHNSTLPQHLFNAVPSNSNHQIKNKTNATILVTIQTASKLNLWTNFLWELISAADSPNRFVLYILF